MKSFKQAYDTIFSLGSNCSVAYQLRENNLRTTSGPFDWIGVNDLSIIINNFNTKFSQFLLPENMVMDLQQDDKLDYYIFTDTMTGIKSIHDIPKSCENIAESLNELQDKFRRRVNRFFDFIQNGNKTLFIRRMEHNDNLLQLRNSLSEIFPNKCVLLGVNHVKNDAVSIKEIQDDVFIANIDCDSDNILKIENFAGNFNNWHILLGSFCELVNPIPRPSIHNERMIIVKENIKLRKPLIWGLGDEFPILEQCFKEFGLNGFVVFDMQKTHYELLPKEMVIDDISLIAKDKYYIVVSYKKYRNEIVEILMNLGFNNTEDYIYFFNESNIFT